MESSDDEVEQFKTPLDALEHFFTPFVEAVPDLELQNLDYDWKGEECLFTDELNLEDAKFKNVNPHTLLSDSDGEIDVYPETSHAEAELKGLDTSELCVGDELIQPDECEVLNPYVTEPEENVLEPTTAVKPAFHHEKIQTTASAKKGQSIDGNKPKIVILQGRQKISISRRPAFVFNKSIDPLFQGIIGSLSYLEWEDVHADKFLHRIEEPLKNFLQDIKSDKFGNVSAERIPQRYVDHTLESMLPIDLMSNVVPVAVPKDEMSFYNSVSIGMFGDPCCAQALRSSLIYHYIRDQNYFNLLSDIMNEDMSDIFENLRTENNPTGTAIQVMSRVLERNISVFTFDDDGTLRDGLRYDQVSQYDRSRGEILMGVFKGSYFPLLPRTSTQRRTVTANVNAASKQNVQHETQGRVKIEEVTQPGDADRSGFCEEEAQVADLHPTVQYTDSTPTTTFRGDQHPDFSILRSCVYSLLEQDMDDIPGLLKSKILGIKEACQSAMIPKENMCFSGTEKKEQTCEVPSNLKFALLENKFQLLSMGHDTIAEAFSVIVYNTHLKSDEVRTFIASNFLFTQGIFKRYFAEFDIDSATVKDSVVTAANNNVTLFIAACVFKRHVNLYIQSWGRMFCARSYSAGIIKPSIKRDVNILFENGKFFPLKPRHKSMTTEQIVDKYPSLVDFLWGKSPVHKQERSLYYFSENYRPHQLPLMDLVSNIHRQCKQCTIFVTSICLHNANELYQAYQILKQEMTNVKYGNCIASSYQSIQRDSPFSKTLPKGLKGVFTAIRNQPDGNCFYAATSNALVRDQYLGKTLRMCAFIEMMTNIDEYRRQFKNVDFDKLGRDLLNDGEWAYSEIIYLMSKVIGRQINVYEYSKNNNSDYAGIYYDANKARDMNTPPVCLFLTGKHFWTLAKTSSNVQAPLLTYTPGEVRDSRLRKDALRTYVLGERRADKDEVIEVIDLDTESENLKIPSETVTISTHEKRRTCMKQRSTADKTPATDSIYTHAVSRNTGLQKDTCQTLGRGDRQADKEQVIEVIDLEEDPQDSSTSSGIDCITTCVEENKQSPQSSQSAGGNKTSDQQELHNTSLKTQDFNADTSSNSASPIKVEVEDVNYIYGQVNRESFTVAEEIETTETTASSDDERMMHSDDFKIYVHDFHFNSPTSVEVVINQPITGEPVKKITLRKIKEPSCTPADAELFANVVASIGEELGDLLQNKSITEVIEFVRDLASGTTVWIRHTKLKCLKRKMAPSKLKTTAKRLATLQRYAHTREKVADMISAFEVNALVDAYASSTMKKWLPKKHSVESPSEEKESSPERSPQLKGNTKLPKIFSFPHTKHIMQKHRDDKNDKKIENRENLQGAKNVTFSESKKDTGAANEPAEQHDGYQADDVKQDPDLPAFDLDEDEDLQQFKSDLIGKEVICSVLNLSPEDLKFQPPFKFELELPTSVLHEIYDFKKEIFLSRKWAAAISKQITTTQKVCSFRARTIPYKIATSTTKQKAFCRMVGSCPCGMHFTITVNEKPSEHAAAVCSVKSWGVFHLKQEKSTSRPISGLERERIQKELKHRKAQAIVLEDLNHLTGLRALHKNFMQKSDHVLRKIKSEGNTKSRQFKDPAKELLHMKAEYIKRDDEQSGGKRIVIKGFIHHENTTPGNLCIYLYDRNSMLLHADQLKRNRVTLHLDATGSMVKRVSEKQILNYVVLGVSKGVTYSIAESIMESGNHINISTFLQFIRFDLCKIKQGIKQPFAHLCVCDFSYAMLYGLCKGVNDEKITDYIQRSWHVLQGTQEWDSERAVIFICTSHLIKSFQRNLSKKFMKSAQNKKIMETALHSLARLQECNCIKDFTYTSRIMMRLFLSKTLIQQDFDSHVKFLLSKRDHVLLDMPDDELDRVELEKVSDAKLLREKSEFYHLFKQIRNEEEINISNVKNVELKNPCYSKTVVDVIQKQHIWVWPLWASAVQQHVTKSDFLRITNAAIEGEFRNRKHIVHPTRNLLYTDYIRDAEKYHTSNTRKATLNLIGTLERKTSKRVRKPKDLQSEIWKKRGKRRPSKYFSSVANRIQAEDRVEEEVNTTLPAKHTDLNASEEQNKNTVEEHEAKKSQSSLSALFSSIVNDHPYFAAVVRRVGGKTSNWFAGEKIAKTSGKKLPEKVDNKLEAPLPPSACTTSELPSKTIKKERDTNERTKLLEQSSVSPAIAKIDSTSSKQFSNLIKNESDSKNSENLQKESNVLPTKGTTSNGSPSKASPNTFKPNVDPKSKELIFESSVGGGATRQQLATVISGDLWLDFEIVDRYMSHILNLSSTNSVCLSRSDFLFRENGKWFGLLLEPLELTTRLLYPMRYIVHPLHDNRHWKLLVFDTHEKMCTVFDSMKPPTLYQQKILNEITTFILPKFTSHAGVNSFGWTVRFSNQQAQQGDVQSCGVFMLATARSILMNPDSFSLSPHLNHWNERVNLLQDMLSTTPQGRAILQRYHGDVSLLKEYILDGLPASTTTSDKQRQFTNEDAIEKDYFFS